MELRNYQLSAVNNTRDVMRVYKRVLIYAPTGSGKTEIGIEIIRLAISKGKRVAFVANRIGLVSQASKRIAKSGINHGIIQGQNSFNIRAQVTVCSIQTIARRGYPDVDLIIVDEAHGCTSAEYVKLFKAHSNIPIIGLSATPFTRGLGKVYEWGPLFEKMIVATTIQELIDQGFLVDVDIYAPEEEPDLRGVKIVHGDYHEGQLGKVLDTPKLVGNIVQHWKKLAYGLPTVVFATSIAHSIHIMESFIAAGITAEHMDCFTSDEDREAIDARYESGETTVICNVSVKAEGWDSPHTACMILARSTRSLARWIQMCGRILRPFLDKNKGIILDHSSTCYLLGYPTDDLPLELNDGTKSESKDAQPQESKPRKCHNCGFMIPPGAGICPKCHCENKRQNKVECEDGELKKVERKEQLTTEQKQEIYSSALGLAEKRKKSEGWAAYLYKDIVGSFPSSSLQKTTCEPVERVIKYAKHKAIAYAKRKKNPGEVNEKNA